MELLEAYRQSGGNKTKAAELLGMSRTTFRRHFDKIESSIGTRVLVIGDTHCPAMLEDYPKFLRKIHDKHGCNRVVHIGDLVDWAAISYHEKDPSLPSAAEEYYHAKNQVNAIKAEFPEADLMIGNHDSLPMRKAQTIGIPQEVIRDFSALWDLDGWTVHDRYEDLTIDAVTYRHGDKCKGGQQAAYKNAMAEFCSVVQGHLHAQAGVVYHANVRQCVYGMQVGCGVDHHYPSMKYGRVYAQKPIVGCGVVYSSKLAFFEPMFL